MKDIDRIIAVFLTVVSMVFLVGRIIKQLLN